MYDKIHYKLKKKKVGLERYALRIKKYNFKKF